METGSPDPILRPSPSVSDQHRPFPQPPLLLDLSFKLRRFHCCVVELSEASGREDNSVVLINRPFDLRVYGTLS